MDSNRLRMTWIDELTPGVVPANPRMRVVRLTGESLQYKPVFINSEEIRSDRMNSDPIMVNVQSQGAVNGELSYPPDGSPFSSWLRSLMSAPWSLRPFRDNDGVAASVITGVAAATGVVTVTAGAAFAVGHLVRLTGFTEADNNGLFRITTGSGTVPAVGADKLEDEAAPPATARITVVGFEGAAADLKTVADGLTSTALNFTTVGLKVGQWIKIGGTGAAYRFDAEGLNTFVRVTAIAANKLTLDNLPVAWAVNAGAGKTVRVFFGDTIRNGVDLFTGTLERGFMSQAQPTYIAQNSMAVAQGEFTFEAEQIAKWVMTFNGTTGSQSIVSLDDTPDPETSNQVMAAAVNVGRIAENGVAVGGPNFVRSFKVSVNNNLRMINAIRSDDKVGPVAIGQGSFDVQVEVETYFGSDALLSKLFAGTPTNISTRIEKNQQALIFAVPRYVYTDGAVSAGGKNQDLMLPLTGQASKDPLTSAHLIIDRLEYYEK
ncbi:phage tail tube protein [Brucella pseudogrignonensis]|uniref:phage tail tube protein n=1 Tax=Brucella pseudogrignonensis TaxID=419475 RepID=UPI0038CFB49A